jgi:hypothetical protein
MTGKSTLLGFCVSSNVVSGPGIASDFEGAALAPPSGSLTTNRPPHLGQLSRLPVA